jgi:excisionase family DNA binding protein
MAIGKKYHRSRPNVQKLTAACATVSAKGSMAITGLGLNTTMNLLRTGQMPAIKVGRRYVIPRNTLLVWLHQSAIAAKIVA